MNILSVLLSRQVQKQTQSSRLEQYRTWDLDQRKTPVLSWKISRTIKYHLICWAKESLITYIVFRSPERHQILGKTNGIFLTQTLVNASSFSSAWYFSEHLLFLSYAVVVVTLYILFLNHMYYSLSLRCKKQRKWKGLRCYLEMASNSFSYLVCCSISLPFVSLSKELLDFCMMPSTEDKSCQDYHVRWSYYCNLNFISLWFYREY